MPKDRYIIGIVSDNKGYPSRKALTQQILAFAEFHKEYPNSHLYMHTCIGNHRGGQDLAPLVLHLGLGDIVHVPNPVKYLAGGYSDSYMATLYSAFDLLSNATMDEGFGVPIIEAQACGTPVVCGEWTAMDELCFTGTAIARGEAEKWWDVTGGFRFLPMVASITDAYEREYEIKNNCEVGNRTFPDEIPNEYSVEAVTPMWEKVLLRIEAKLKQEVAK
jgi:glycosyltransferase involved in cell wall biosynthesis